MRVKRGITSHAKHKKIFEANKGFRMTKHRLIKVAKQAFLHAGEHAYHGRKRKKRDFRRLWITRISEALKLQGLSYNVFINSLKKANITIDRKIMASLIVEKPTLFQAIVEKTQFTQSKAG